MKGGRLRIVNESRYPDDEVEALVRFGLSEIDLTGTGITAVVKNTRASKRRDSGAVEYSGTAYSLNRGIPRTLYDRYIGRRRDEHLIVVRLGPPEAFPIEPYHRNGVVHDYRSWQEALVGITAHEGKHAEHHHDGAYTTRSGRRAPATFTDAATGRKVPFRRGGSVRVGTERIEPKCEAFEVGMLRRYREAPAVK